MRAPGFDLRCVACSAEAGTRGYTGVKSERVRADRVARCAEKCFMSGVPFTCIRDWATIIRLLAEDDQNLSARRCEGS